MKLTLRIGGALAAATLLVSCQNAGTGPHATALHYPPARRDAKVDDYFGTQVPAPYRWLENLDSPETRAWVKAENDLTTSYLAKIPGREAIRGKLTELWNYERTGIPVREGGRTFFTRNDGLQPQSVLYAVTATGAEPRVLLDPNTLSADGTVALAGWTVSHNGRLLAYALSSGGSDWREWHVREVDSGRDLPDLVRWSKFSRATWAPDDRGFYYGRFAQPAEGVALKQANYFQKLYFHTIGTPQDEDSLIYERPDHKDWQFGSIVTEDGRYLIVPVRVGTDRRNMVFFRDLRAPDGAVKELLPAFDASYDFVANDGPVLYFRTDNGAPLGRVIAVDTGNPSPRAWREIIPEQDDTLQGAHLVHDTFVATYLSNAATAVRLFHIDGTAAGRVALPDLGTARGFDGKRTDTSTFYSFASFTSPATIYELDLATGASSVFDAPRMTFDPASFVTKQVFYTSKDGTRIPMFISHRKSVVLNGANPTLLYAYGGFDISQTPRFSVPSMVWMEMGGVYAVANVRGGGEYGETWHQAGMLKDKQNVFDDFIAAAQWLIDNRYTSTERLGISGRSNGGLLVGAVLDQRPDLFGAAVPGVGVMDMLRFQKFTIGWAWVSEYGSSDDPAMFPVLHAYSPLHNIEAGTHYPPTLITTADHDDRVIPAHSFKYAAALQAAQGGTAPILIRIETRAGHGSGKPIAKQIDEATDELLFLTHALRVDVRL